MSWQYTSRKPTGLSTSVTTSSHQSLPASGNPWDGRRTPTYLPTYLPTYTRIERDYDTLRADLRILFNDPSSTAAQTTN